MLPVHSNCSKHDEKSYLPQLVYLQPFLFFCQLVLLLSDFSFSPVIQGRPLDTLGQLRACQASQNPVASFRNVLAIYQKVRMMSTIIEEWLVVPRKGMLMHQLAVAKVLVYEIHGLAECQCGKFIEGGQRIFFYSIGDVNIIIPFE
jgi:hypothetical protein